jgi:hypothetical protein
LPGSATAGSAAVQPIENPTHPPLPLRLLYASAPGPSHPAVSASSATHALYEAGGLCLDLRLSREGLSNQMVLVGQIADLSAPGMPVGALPVSLESPAGPIARDVCNQFGEFCLHYVADRQLNLRVSVGRRGALVLPLPGSRETDSCRYRPLQSANEQHVEEEPS